MSRARQQSFLYWLQRSVNLPQERKDALWPMLSTRNPSNPQQMRCPSLDTNFVLEFKHDLPVSCLQGDLEKQTREMDLFFNPKGR